MSRYITTTPVQKALLNISAAIEKAWLHWFSEIGDGLNGLWGVESRKLASVNLSREPDTEVLSHQGRELTLLFVWDSAITFSSVTFSLDKSDSTMEQGMLNVWDGSTLVGGAYCTGTSIQVPDIAISGRCIIQGTVITRTTR
jgi:hypothetical protein